MQIGSLESIHLRSPIPISSLKVACSHFPETPTPIIPCHIFPRHGLPLPASSLRDAAFHFPETPISIPLLSCRGGQGPAPQFTAPHLIAQGGTVCASLKPLSPVPHSLRHYFRRARPFAMVRPSPSHRSRGTVRASLKPLSPVPHSLPHYFRRARPFAMVRPSPSHRSRGTGRAAATRSHGSCITTTIKERPPLSMKY